MIHDGLRFRDSASRPRRLVALCFALACSCWVHTARADDYRVGPLDRLRIKVSEWRPASSEIFQWEALNGEFAVDSAGKLSIPIIGVIAAGNETTAEIASAISERLKSVAGLVDGPVAAVEIAQYRPFYVVGAVEKPGEYAYRPGLTVIQAISIAGGFYRAEASLARFERDTISAEGEIKVQDAQRLGLLLRRDRLTSEARNADRIAFSDAVTRYPDAARAQQGMREESAVFSTRQTTIRTQTQLLNQSKDMLADELKTLAAKAVALAKQQDLVRKDLDNINSLMSKGLSVSTRQLSLEQNLAQLESQALDLVLATARTRQDIGKADLSLAELQNKRETEVNKELRETQVALSQTTERIEALKALVYESSVSAPRLLAKNERDAARLAATIVRTEAGGEQEIAASEMDRLKPGDIIKIGRPGLEKGLDAAQAQPSAGAGGLAMARSN